MLRSALSIGLVALALAASSARAQTVDDPSLSIDSLAPSGLAAPTSMAFVGPDDFLVLEKQGRVRRVRNGVLSPVPVLTPLVDDTGERGMLGIAVDASTTPVHVFLYYSELSAPREMGGVLLGNRVYRYDWDPAVPSLTNPVLVLDLPANQGAPAGHLGGVILLGPPDDPPGPPLLYAVIGNLYSPIGVLQNLPGGAPPNDYSVIYRVQQDGSAAPGNPFKPWCSRSTELECEIDDDCPGEEVCRTQVARYYAYGVRNSFGLGIDPRTGFLWDTENGDTDYDEVNLVRPGFNSGYTPIMGPDARDPQGLGDIFHMPLAPEGYSDPEFSWLSTIAPTGIVFPYRSTLGLAYERMALVGDANFGRIHALRLNFDRNGFFVKNIPGLADLVADNFAEDDAQVFGRGFSSITDLEMGPDGNLYVVSLYPPNVYRVRGTAQVPAQPPVALAVLVLLLAGAGTLFARTRLS
jgi:glucose/arabinose dehydrogenase